MVVDRRAQALGAVLVLLLYPCVAGASASLRFYGHGGSTGDGFVFPDRVKVDSAPTSAANVGSGDFTVEFFVRASAAENPNPSQSCGFGIDWVNGNILIDRDRYNQWRQWGIALLGGRVAFGASNDLVGYTLCGSAVVTDDAWHHVAVERRAADGRMRVWVDGALDAEGPVTGGPSGDMSYPAGAIPGDYCNPDGGAGSSSCANSDPYLVFGAEKHGFSGINYSGWLDEIRLSESLRYDTAFTPPTAPFAPDADTAALYHFDEVGGSVAIDASGGGSDGTLFFGGDPPAGPVRSSETPFAAELPFAGGASLALLAAGLGVAGVGLARSARARTGRGR
jgi:hypothetical protein